MSKSDYLEAQLLDHVLGDGTFTKPGTVHVALYTAAPTDAGGGTEVSGGGYARAAVTNDVTNWPDASGGVKSNGQAITFPQATASWGTIVAWAIFDAATGGNMLIHGTVNPNKAVAQDDTAEFAAGALTWTED